MMPEQQSLMDYKVAGSGSKNGPRAVFKPSYLQWETQMLAPASPVQNKLHVTFYWSFSLQYYSSQ